MDTSLLRGLALLETQDGKKSIKGPNGEDSFNLFNIKDFGKEGNGYRAYDKAEKSNDRYRVYGSREDSIQDVVSLIERKYPDAHKALQSGDAEGFARGLKAGGYATDPNYEKKLVGTISRARGLDGDSKKAVQQATLDNDGAMGQLAALRRTGWAADIDEAIAKGWSASEIVQRIAGAEVQEAEQARQRADQRGFVGNVKQGASDAVSDIALGARQIVASGDDEQRLRDEAAQRRGDIDRQATGNTVGGFIGRAAPSVAAGTAAALATGGGALPFIAGQAAVSAADGALQPTVEDGERLSNAVTGGLVGGGLSAIPGVGGSAGRRAAGSMGRSSQVVSEREALANALRAEGLPVNASTLTDIGRNVTDAMPDNASVRAMRDRVDSTIAGKVSDELGLPQMAGRSINTDMLEEARPLIGQRLDAVTNVDITLPQSLKTELNQMVQDSSNPLTQGIASNNTVRQAVNNISAVVDSGRSVNGKMLQDLASELKELMQSGTASAAEKKTAGQLVGKVNKALLDAMTPDQASAFTAANRQYSALKALEKMVSLSNDTGAVSPRQMIQAVKTGRFKSQFLRGEAPFQDLAKLAVEAVGPANGRGLGDVIAKSLRAGGDATTAATILEPTSGLVAKAGLGIGRALAGRLATSENPAVVRLLTGVGGSGSSKKAVSPEMKRYLAQALGVSAAALGTQ